MRVDNLASRDYHNAANSLGPDWQTAFDPAEVSFDVVWSRPITRRLHVGDGTLGNNYAGQYVENQVTVTWSGTNLAEGFTFTANPGTFATSVVDGGFAELGHEHNGIFDPHDPAPHGDGGGAGTSLDPAFAALPQTGASSAAPQFEPTLALGGVGLAPPASFSDPGSGAGRLVPTQALDSGSAGAVQAITTAQAAPENGAALLADPAATWARVFADIGA
jgi:hypothetical protein